MFRYLFIVVFTLLFAKDLAGQKLIFGQVTDGSTQEVLPYVNVYINNSTIGTNTNERGDYSLKIPGGKYELVFSSVGYLSKKLPVSVASADTFKLDIKLMPMQKHLQTVTIEGSPDKEWEKLIKQFNRVFLGDTKSASSCVIKNDWCIDLTSQRMGGKKILIARATQPLEIENFSLGYKIIYELLNFSSAEENVRFSGNVYFIELKPKDESQAEHWFRNRMDSYKGSLRHFFNSILTNKVTEEGFELVKCRLLSDGKLKEVGPYKPSAIRLDSLKGGFRIWLPNVIQIIYENPSEPNTQLQGTILNGKGYMDVDDSGMLLDPLAVTITGYLGVFRVADLLPDNYRPNVSGTNN